jgi:hypothetical protein
MFDILFLAYITTAGFTIVILWSIYKFCQIRLHIDEVEREVYYIPLPSAPPLEENAIDV